jgi:predicted O-methyltransferase YrrM
LRGGAALFDLVHVDGGHDSATVLRDVRDVLPRLRAGGFLVLDDVSWPSVHPAYELAARHLDVLHQRSTGSDDFAVLRRRGSRLELAELRALLRHVGRAR